MHLTPRSKQSGAPCSRALLKVDASSQGINNHPEVIWQLFFLHACTYHIKCDPMPESVMLMKSWPWALPPWLLRCPLLYSGLKVFSVPQKMSKHSAEWRRRDGALQLCFSWQIILKRVRFLWLLCSHAWANLAKCERRPKWRLNGRFFVFFKWTKTKGKKEKVTVGKYNSKLVY